MYLYYVFFFISLGLVWWVSLVSLVRGWIRPDSVLLCFKGGIGENGQKSKQIVRNISDGIKLLFWSLFVRSLFALPSLIIADNERTITEQKMDKCRWKYWRNIFCISFDFTWFPDFIWLKNKAIRLNALSISLLLLIFEGL